MERIRSRRVGAPFDGEFFRRDPHFAPIARAAELFATRGDWPDVLDYNQLFRDDARAVRFIKARPIGRRRRKLNLGPVIDASSLYDGAITTRAEVPTRARSWHDYLNALVWATFPQAKRALHERQHARIAARIAEDPSRLPMARTPELDTLAMIDEGGVIHAETPRGTETILFGHALYEAIVLDEPHVRARSVTLQVDSADDVDTVFARLLTDEARFTTAADLGQYVLR